MNKEHITDAIGMIDDNMLSHTDSLRKERRSHSSHKSMLRIIAAAAAVLTVAVCGVAGLAAIKGGYFSDEKNIFGAVTGTRYEQATEEISVSAQTNGIYVDISIELLNIGEAPYCYLETLAIGEYSLTDDSGATTDIDLAEIQAAISDGKAVVSVPVSSLNDGRYSLEITQLIAGKKADADLIITGRWDVGFEV